MEENAARLWLRLCFGQSSQLSYPHVPVSGGSMNRCPRDMEGKPYFLSAYLPEKRYAVT